MLEVFYLLLSKKASLQNYCIGRKRTVTYLQTVHSFLCSYRCLI